MVPASRHATVIVLATLGAALPARAEPATILGLGAHLDSDGRDNPVTNDLSYVGLHASYARRVSPELRWQLVAGLGGIVGAETDGSHADLGVGASMRTGGATFAGVHADLGWSYNRSDNVGTVCGSHGVLGRITAELGVRVGHGAALVLHAGVRARQILAYQCTGDAWASDRGLNRGPTVGLAYEWTP